MVYLLYVYLIGAVASLVFILHHMTTPEATAMEVLAMAGNKTNALRNFLGNLIALIVVPAIWPGIVLYYPFRK